MRALTNYERSLLDLLLSKNFTGRDELREQSKSAYVEELCNGEILKFHTYSATTPPKLPRIPVEAAAQDVDGVLIRALLHVSDSGFLKHIEFYKDDGSEIRTMPNLSAWHLDPWDPVGRNSADVG